MSNVDVYCLQENAYFQVELSRAKQLSWIHTVEQNIFVHCNHCATYLTCLTTYLLTYLQRT